MWKMWLAKRGASEIVWKILYIVLFAVQCLFGLSSGLKKSTNQLLRTQDGYIIESSLQGSENDVRLEDFFWTGSGDGPPNYVRKPNLANMDGGRDTIIKTSTVVATVYIDGNLNNKDEDAPSCLFQNCNSDVPIKYPKDYLPSDRRFWLLTILSGYFLPQDFPFIEQKLATLYRIAFSRQQSWHLGIANDTIDNNFNKGKRSPHNNGNITKISSGKLFEYELNTKNIINMMDIKNNTSPLDNNNNNNGDEKHHLNKRNINYEEKKDNTSAAATTTTTIESISPTTTTAPTIIGFDKEHQKIMPRREIDEKNANESRKISVLVHNITLLSDNLRSVNQDERTIITKMENDTSFLNQTEIIYSVFVDGKPILATTAADDMKLVTEDEVAQVMEKMVYTKAEPYLKEPLATPLIPSMETTTSEANENSNLFAIFSKNVVVLIVGIIMIIALVSLLIGLLLMTRAKRKRSAEVKRLTSRSSLISPDMLKKSDGSDEKRVRIDEGGHQGLENSAFEEDQVDMANRVKNKKAGKPTLHFPQPPLSSPSSSTSDSSVYYPKRRSKLDIQNILDEKAANLFYKRSKTDENNQQTNAIYATITKKKDRKKNKRKYLSENRVGSMDEAQIHSSQSSTSSDAFEATRTFPNHHYYEPVEAFNPNVPNHYHKNKVLQDANFTARSPDEDLESPTEAFNKEILKALQRDNRSPGDSCSIGSYLSMASVKSFPKCSVPEPLSRVLEPVSVTHLDQDSSDHACNKMPRIVDARFKNNSDLRNFVTNETTDIHFSRSQSDGADPGVIGPVVWEIHKKHMEQKEITSPLRDPVQTRTRFEGLLEGAIKLYSNDVGDESYNNDVHVISEVPGAIRQKDNRGKSANNKPSILSRSNSGNFNRPVTAGTSFHQNEYATQPPSPYKKAWGSGAPSPLVRPLSAGPFHRPEAPLVDVTRVLASQNYNNSTTILSTAPLIEAIQNELKKFNK